MGTLVEIVRALGREVQEDDLTGLAGEVAYNLLLALFPALIFVAALTGFVGNAIGVDGLFGQAIGYLRQVMPPSAVETITGPLLGILTTQSGGLLSFGALGTLWAASNAVAVMMKAFNRAYGVRETRPFWLHRLLIAVGLTLLLALLVLAAFLLFVFGGQLGRAVAGMVGADAAFVVVWEVLRWPLSALAIMTALAALYWAGPNVRQSVRWILPGLLVATALWLLFTWLFQLYIENFGRYDATYGAVAGVIVLLLWLNYSSLVFLVGAEVNQVVRRRYGPASITPAAPAPFVPTTPIVAAPVVAAGRPTSATSWPALAALLAWSTLIAIGALLRGGRRDG